MEVQVAKYKYILSFKDVCLFVFTIVPNLTIVQGYTLAKLKICFRKFYGRYNDQLQHYITSLSHVLCDSYVDVCYIHRIWPNRILVLVMLLILRRGRDHIRWSLLSTRTYSHTWVFRCPCCLVCDIYSRLV